MRRIAFFGGSFDPPHKGHLAIATAAADRFALDQVLFAPVGRQPLKAVQAAASFVDRYAMVTLAMQHDNRFVPSLLEAPIDDAPNYTVDALQRLRNSLGGEDLLFTLVGADSWLDLPRWHEPERLLGLTNWIIAARPGFSLEAAGPDRSVLYLADTREDISASEVRASIAAGGSVRGLVPEGVWSYIAKVGLYKGSSIGSL